jgi:hypothetical protein
VASTHHLIVSNVAADMHLCLVVIDESNFLLDAHLGEDKLTLE